MTIFNQRFVVALNFSSSSRGVLYGFFSFFWKRFFERRVCDISVSRVDVLTFDGINVATSWSQFWRRWIRLERFQLDRIELAINITANV